MPNRMTIYDFEPLYLTLERVGPFEAPYKIDFTDEKSKPCNFFMLVAANGFGKTTVLDTMASLMKLLQTEPPERYGQEDLDTGRGRAQLDFLVKAHWQGKDRSFVLSVFGGRMGDELSLKPWDTTTLEDHGAREWFRCGHLLTAAGRIKAMSSHKSDGFIADLLTDMDGNTQRPPEGFESSLYHLPTLLYFSAYRDIPPLAEELPAAARQMLEAMGVPGRLGRNISQPAHWGYRPLHAFSPHNEHWGYSLDNLLVWLRWLGDRRFDRAREIINKRVFDGTSKAFVDVQRDPPEAMIHVGEEGDENFHRLDRLSSGEKNLVQLFLRIGAHMTRNTILLIDEFDVHLHIRWQHKLFNALKEMAEEHPGMHVIVTTHSVEILDTFVNSMDIPEGSDEHPLIKGGHLIEDLR